MTSPRGGSSEHRLAFLDQTALELLRATGRNQLVQCVWIYEHPIDHDGLNRFHRNFCASLAGRLIERSRLPVGRPRWVQPPGLTPLQIGQTVRPRRELLNWVDELGDLPIDPERGPACYVAVQAFDDGTTGVCVIASHVIGDGVGGMMAIFEAVSGMERNTGYDAPGARTPSKALIADVRQIVRDLPLTARTAVKAFKMVRAKRADFARARAAQGAGSGGRLVRVPSVVVFVDTQDWDSRAECIGGNSYSLLAGFAAKLAERLGRRRSADGAVTLLIAINQRESLDDDRALAMAFANAVVDPDKVTVDLTDARAAVRDAREKAKQETDPVMDLLPLIPWLPRGAVKGVADLMFAYSEDLPVSCSNLGDLPPEIAQADGTPAEYMFIRGLDTNVTEAELQRSHGQLVLVSGRIGGKISISIEGYQLGVENSKERLRSLVAETLSEFGLTGVIE
ncbi:MAG: hypothetical protein ACR2JS_03765 [Candidatus Nanopelagicales bacterium]